MAKIGLVGPSYQQRSLPFDAQRSVNLFPIADQQGKETAALYGVPGTSLFATSETGGGRACFAAANGRSFVVFANRVRELFADGTTNSIGSLATSFGPVTMDENGFQLAVCDGISLYIFNYSTGVFTQVSTTLIPSAGSVTFVDGYFVVSRLNSGIFQLSGLYDGTIWPALQFATAESSPDNLLRVLNVVGQLWLFGDRTTEIWSNTGASPFPFQRIAGAKLEVGVNSAFTALPLDNSAFWVGKDVNGLGIVYRAEGFSPQRISTEAIEYRIATAPFPSSLRSWSYQEDGHAFYIITGGGMETALVYDLATQLWHERAYLNDDGNYELPIQSCGMFAFNRHIVLDRRNGRIYEQRIDLYSDNGDEIVNDRIYTHISDENQRFTIKNLTIGFETGVGTSTGLDADPQVTLYISRDGGKTFDEGRTASFGRIGQYRQRVIFRRLGQARELTFRIRITSSVKVAIIGSYMNTKD